MIRHPARIFTSRFHHKSFSLISSSSVSIQQKRFCSSSAVADPEDGVSSPSAEQDQFTTDQVVLAIQTEFPSTALKSPQSNKNQEQQEDEEESLRHPLLRQLKIDPKHATAHQGKTLAIPFLPRHTSDFELAMQIASRSLIRASGLQLKRRDGGFFHFEVTYANAPSLMYSQHVVVAEQGSANKRNKVTGEKEVSVKTVVRNSRTNSSEATAVVSYHIFS